VVRKKIYYCILQLGITLLIAGLAGNVSAQQNGLLQNIDLNDSLRIAQLTEQKGEVQRAANHFSFLLQPLPKLPVTDYRKKPSVVLQKITVSNYYNDSLAYGYNNESFYPATGWQTRVSIGAEMRWWRLRLKLQPEWVTAQNRQQAEIPSAYTDANFFSRYYFMNINVIDAPSRFGTQPVTKFFPGQSSLRLEMNNWSVGVSTENLRWGPGIYNTLVMGNNAPGFLHVDIRTTQPVKTKIGWLEAQAILGKLDSSGIEPVENVRQFAQFWPGAYVPKISETNRGIFAFMVSLEPKWVPGLFLGAAFSHYFYFRNTDSTGKPFASYPYTVNQPNQYGASLGSLFFRYTMPGDGAEFYAEVGRADKAATLFNLFGDTVPIAYVVGLRKLMPVGKKRRDRIEFSAEIAHLQLPDPRLIFGQDNPFGVPKTRGWYTHPSIRQGYTQYGQMLGAGIGPGSNSQNLSLTWHSPRASLGIHAERVVHNEDFYYYSHISGGLGYGVPNMHWVDLTYGIHGMYRYNAFILAGRISKVSALNYKWVKADGTLDGPSSLSDKKNLHMALSIGWLFYQ
jgi:hypothetical protein